MLISTCNPDLDAALDGGFPRSFVEVTSPDGAAMDMALDVARNVIDQGGIAALVDMGRDVEGPFPDMLVAQPNDVDQGLGLIQALMDTGVVDLIVVNGACAVTGDVQVGDQVRLLHDAIASSRLHEDGHLGTCVVFVRRMPPTGLEDAPVGGNHCADVHLDVRGGFIRLVKPDISG
jgi:hypothetical protein